MAAASSSAVAPAALSQGSGLSSRYRRLDESSSHGHIGKGSFGRVFVALDTVTDITVAVKRQVLPSDDAMRELQFYKALSQVPHPNVMQLLDHFVAKGMAGTCLYMVFDFMDTTLWHMWTHRRQLLPPPVCIAALRQVAAAVGHVHDVGLVHTDLSMANMLVSSGKASALSHASEGHLVRLADFGGAVSAVGALLPEHRTITTEYARAPETLLGDKQPTQAVDMWALGVVTMALTCGSLVFYRRSDIEQSANGLFWCLDDPEDVSSGSEPRPLSLPGHRTLANQISVLGTLTEDLFPGCSALPRWASMQEAICREPLWPTLSLFLAEISCVRRPLHASDAAVSLICELLCWDPRRRLRAKACQAHRFFSFGGDDAHGGSGLGRAITHAMFEGLGFSVFAFRGACAVGFRGAGGLECYSRCGRGC